jgi:hypothetical protein
MTFHNEVSITEWMYLPKGEWFITPKTQVFFDDFKKDYFTRLAFRPDSKGYGREEGKGYDVPFVTADGSQLWKSSGKKDAPTNHIQHFMEDGAFTIRGKSEDEVRFKMTAVSAALRSKNDLSKGQFLKIRVKKRIFSADDLLRKTANLKAAIEGGKPAKECMKIFYTGWEINDFEILVVEASKNAAGQRTETEVRTIISSFDWNKQWAAAQQTALSAGAPAAPIAEEDLPF